MVAARASVSACGAARRVDRLGAVLRRHHVAGSGTAAWRRARAAGWSPAAPAARPRRPGCASTMLAERLRIGCDIARRPAPARSSSAERRPSTRRAGPCAAITCALLVSAWSKLGREQLAELLVETVSTRKSMPCAWPISRSICWSVWVSACSSGKSIRRQVLRLVDQHRRLVLERLDLVVDLLQRARGGQQVLAVVARDRTR